MRRRREEEKEEKEKKNRPTLARDEDGLVQVVPPKIGIRVLCYGKQMGWVRP